MFLKVVTLLVVVEVVLSATFLATRPETPAHLAHKKGCFIKEIDDVIPFGEDVAPIGSCLRIGCSGRYIDYATCGKVSAEPPCYVTKENTDLPYPDCCPSIECDQDNDIQSGSMII